MASQGGVRYGEASLGMIFLSVSKDEKLELTEAEYYGLVAELYEDQYPESRRGTAFLVHVAERTIGAKP